MHSYLLPPFAMATARSAPIARSSSTADRDGFAHELESRINGSRDRQRGSPLDGSDLDEGPSAGLTDGRDRRPDRLTSDRAERRDAIKPVPVDVPSEPSAGSSDEVTSGTANDAGTSGDSLASSSGVAASFNRTTLSTSPAANVSGPTTSIAATSVEAGSNNATGDGTPNATTQREGPRLRAEPGRAAARTGSASVRNDPLLSPLEPLRASVIEESRTDGAGEGASASPVEPTATPNPATQLARALVELAGGNTGPSGPVVTPEVGTTSEAPALSPNVVAVAGTSVAGPTLAPTPAAQGGGATSDVAGMTPAPTTEAEAPLQDVVKFVAGNVGSRNAHVRIQLDPPELGAMRIDIRTRQQTLTVRIEVETADALARIQSGAAQLKQSLEQHGLVVDRFDVQLRPTDSASPQSDGGDAREDRFAQPHSSFERDRPENESSHPEEPSSADPGADRDDSNEDTETGASDREARRSTLTAASVDVWA